MKKEKIGNILTVIGGVGVLIFFIWFSICCLGQGDKRDIISMTISFIGFALSGATAGCGAYLRSKAELDITNIVVDQKIAETNKEKSNSTKIETTKK